MKFKHKATGAVITCIKWTGTDQSYGYIHNRLKKLGIECSDNFGSIIMKNKGEPDFIVPPGYWIWFSSVDGKPVRRYTHADLYKNYDPVRK